MNRWRHTPRGATLLEALVASSMLLVALAAMFALNRYQTFALRAQDVQLDTQESARAVLDLFAREVRQAGADPLCTHAFEGIAAAGAATLQIQFDRNANGTIDAGESVTYRYSAADGSISRTCSGVTTVLASGAPGAATNFTFYDGAGAAITPAGSGATLSAAQRATVRRVQIRLAVVQPNVDPTANLPLVTNVSTSVDLRNRFMNGSTACP